jgi:hypothetical protein
MKLPAVALASAFAAGMLLGPQPFFGARHIRQSSSARRALRTLHTVEDPPCPGPPYGRPSLALAQRWDQ